MSEINKTPLKEFLCMYRGFIIMKSKTSHRFYVGLFSFPTIAQAMLYIDVQHNG